MSSQIAHGRNAPVKFVRPLGRQNKQESGSVLLIVAGIMIPLFLGFAMIAIDLSRLALVRGELQNAADAAALVGAESLMQSSGKNISNAQGDATAYVLLNKAGGKNPNISVTPRAGCVNPATKIWASMPSNKICAAPNLGGMRLTIVNQTTVLGFARIFYIRDEPFKVSAAAVLINVPPSGQKARLLY